MSAKNHKLSRRNFIKGLSSAGILMGGASFNELMAQATTPAPLRVLFVAIQHGWGIGDETTGPSGNVSNFSGTETSFTLPTTLSPFESIKNQCIFIDGLRGTFWDNAHDVSYTDILTCGVPAGGTAQNLPGSTYAFPKPFNSSIDYEIENFSKKPALRLSAGYGSWGAQYHPLSFNSSLAILPYYTRALDAYNQVFKNVTAPVADKVTPRVMAGVTDTTTELLNKVQGAPRQRLLNYRDALESLKTSIAAQGGSVSGSAKLEKIPVSGQTQDMEVDNFIDMIRVAFVNDTHRVAVLGIGEPEGNITYTGSNGQPTDILAEERKAATDFHHTIGHYSGGEAAQGYDATNAKLGFAATRRWYCQKVLNLVQKLQSAVDVDGKSVLDNTLIVLTGEVATGEHATVSKMHVVIGGGSRIRKGRWINNLEGRL